MKYRWTTCPDCRCEVAINYSETAAGISGSVRRWDHNRTINDGRAFHVASAEATPGAGFSVDCVCGRQLDVPAHADAVSAEREPDLRVTLGEGKKN